MAHFTRVRVDLAAWGYGTGVSQAEFNKFDLLYKAINGDDGGTWDPSSAIVIGGSGIIIDSTAPFVVQSTASFTVACLANFTGSASIGDSTGDTFNVIATQSYTGPETHHGAETHYGWETHYGGETHYEAETHNGGETHYGAETHNGDETHYGAVQTYTGAETHNGAATFNNVVTLGGSTGNGTNSHGPIIEGIGSGYAGHYVPSITWINDANVTVSSRSASRYIWQAITASRTAILAFSGTRNGETIEFVNASASYLVSIYANGSADALGTIGGAADQYHRCELVWNLGLAGWSLVFS